ncbi:hypothetical protein D9758_003715 [Tetrapyrgos nigripes]|uniref:Uncharacterized protein n=1 Tax=Tetrapyrgos nigripes TaxID=182062 RepID=A0A8H5LSA7_9AGAR|nr:hypothetical protein D9758_003715 [Tetrapyrgos nigripes]
MSESLASKLDRYFLLAGNQYTDLRKDASPLQSYNSRIKDIINKAAEISPDTVLEDTQKAEDVCKKLDVSSPDERVEIISAAFTIINAIMLSDLPKQPETVRNEVKEHYEDSKSRLSRLLVGESQIGEEISDEFIASFTKNPLQYVGKQFILNPDSEAFGNDEALQYKIDKVQTGDDETIVHLRFEDLPDIIEMPLDEAVVALKDSWFA